MKKFILLGILLLMISTAYGSSVSNLWKFEEGGKGKLSLDDEGDYIAVGDKDGNVYLYDKDGKLIWKNKIDGKVDAIYYYGDKKVAVGSGKDVYLFDGNGNIIERFSIDNGNITDIKCYFYLGDYHYTNYTEIFIGTDSGYVYCYRDDDLEWKYKTNGKIINLLFPSYSNDYIYASSGDGRVYALNSYGAEWDLKFNDSPIISKYVKTTEMYNTTYITDYLVVGAGNDIYVYNVSYSYLTYQSYYPIPMWEESINNPIIMVSASNDGNYILLADDKNNIYCFNAKNGDENWKIHLNGSVVSIDAGKGNIFAVATNSTLYILENRGEIIKTLPISGTDVSIPEETGDYVAVIDNKDCLYYIDRDGNIVWKQDLKPGFNKLYVGDNFSIATVWVDINNNSIYDNINELSYIYVFNNSKGLISRDWIYTKVSSIDFSNNDNYVIAGEDGKVSLYKIPDVLLWRFKEKKGAYCAKIIGNEVYIGTFDKIEVLNNNGSEIREYNVNGMPISLDYYNSTVFVGCENGNTYFIKNNHIIFYKKVENLKKVYLSKVPIIWGDKLYLGNITINNPKTVDANKNIIVVGNNKLAVYNINGKKLWELNIKPKKVSVSNNNVISAIDNKYLYIIYNGKIISKILINDPNGVKYLEISPEGRYVGLGSNYISMYDTGLRYIFINSTPENATVLIDNEIVGKTPLTVPLFVGTHSISLKKSGYKPITETLFVRENSKFNYILQKLNLQNSSNIGKTSSFSQKVIIINKLPITITHPGIYIINRSFWDLNETAITIITDNVTILGNFNVIDGIGKGTAIVCNGSNITIRDLILTDWDKDIFGNVNRSLINNVRIIKNTNFIYYHDILNNNKIGEVVVESTPSSIIYIDNKFYGETPKEIKLKPGLYNLTLIRRGYSPYIKRILVNKGIKTFIAVKLNKLPANFKYANNSLKLDVNVNKGAIPINGYATLTVIIKNPEENKLKLLSEVVLKSDLPVVEGAESGGGGIYNSEVILSPGESKTLNYKIEGTLPGNHTVEITVYGFPEGNKTVYTSICKNITIQVYKSNSEQKLSFIDYLLKLFGWR